MNGLPKEPWKINRSTGEIEPVPPYFYTTPPTTTITLAGDVSGPSGSNTVDTVGYHTAGEVNSGVTDILTSTDAATAFKIVRRDVAGSASFVALNATTFNGDLSGTVGGSKSTADVVTSVTLTENATDVVTPLSLVRRTPEGSFDVNYLLANSVNSQNVYVRNSAETDYLQIKETPTGFGISDQSDNQFIKFEHDTVLNKCASLLPLNATESVGASGDKWEKLYTSNITDDGTDVSVSSTKLKHGFLYNINFGGIYGDIWDNLDIPIINTTTNSASACIDITLTSGKTGNTSSNGFSCIRLRGWLSLRTSDTDIFVEEYTTNGASLSSASTDGQVYCRWIHGGGGDNSGTVRVYFNPLNTQGYTAVNVDLLINATWVSVGTPTSGDGVAPTISLNTQTTKYTTNVRPLADSTYSLGTSGIRWLDGYFDNLYISTGPVTTSDKRQKENIKDFSGGVELLKKFKCKEYKYKKDKKKKKFFGFIAQDIEEDGLVDPSLQDIGLLEKEEVVERVEEDGEKVDKVVGHEYGVRYEGFIAPLVRAVQELAERVEQLEEELKHKKPKI